MLGRRWSSLRIKIIAWSFIPASIILTAVALVNYYAYQRVAEDLVLGRNQELTRLSASQLASEVGQYANLLEGLARNADIYRADPEAQRAALARVRNRLVVFDAGVVLIDRLGRVVAAEPERPDLVGQNWANRSYYSQMLRTASPVYSDVVADGPAGSRVIVVAVPITGEQNDFQGVLAGMFRLGASSVSAFYGGIVKLRIGEGGTLLLMDSVGRVIYDTDAELIGSDASGNSVIQQFLGRKTAQVNGGMKGEAAVASFAPVPGTPWGLVVEESWDALTKPSQSYRQFLIVLLVMGVVVPALVVTVGARRITGPITQLAVAAREVAGGNFGRTTDIRTGDELENLADQFNAMSAELKESYADLEQKVADRTKELSALANENARLFAAERKRAEQFRLINEASRTITSILSERDLVWEIGQLVRDVLGYHTAIIGIIEGRELAFDLRSGVEMEEGDSPILRLDVGSEAITAWVARTGEPVIVPDVSKDPRYYRRTPSVKTMSELAVPLKGRESVVGVLDVGSDRPSAFDESDLVVLQTLAYQAAVAIENARLYEQAQRLAVVEERNRLARDLHDSVTQAMYSVTLYAEAASRMLASGDVELATEHVAELRGTAQQALREMRSLIFELRPSLLEKEGLVAALQSRLEAVESRAGLAVEFEAEGVDGLPAAVENGLYGISQEAFNNILKHSRASKVTLRLLRSDRNVVMEIADDGTGFDPVEIRERGGLGVKGMEERAATFGGKLTVDSAPGQGTKVRVEVTL